MNTIPTTEDAPSTAETLPLKYVNLMEYLPMKYPPTLEEEKNRRIVSNFKMGRCSRELKNEFTDTINQLKEERKDMNLRVCFIPASTHHKTACRYQKLATFIEKETGIACDYHTILPIQDQESGHITGKKANPAENFTIKTSDVDGKNIILIDDVITRGMTFMQTTNKLIRNGANMVRGLFLAKTINPDRVRHSA